MDYYSTCSRFWPKYVPFYCITLFTFDRKLEFRMGRSPNYLERVCDEWLTCYRWYLNILVDMISGLMVFTLMVPTTLLGVFILMIVLITCSVLLLHLKLSSKHTTVLLIKVQHQKPLSENKLMSLDVTWRQYYHALADGIGKRRPTFSIPLWLAKIVAWGMSSSCFWSILVLTMCF